VAAFALGPSARAAGYRLAAFSTIGSTNSEAMARARGGDPGRLWVVAAEQTAGRGRRGRRWVTPPGNLAASLLIHAEPGEPAATLGFVAGLALSDAFESLGSFRGSLQRTAGAFPPPARGRGGEGVRIAASEADVGRPPSGSPLTGGRTGTGEGHGTSPRLQIRVGIDGGDGPGTPAFALKWPNDGLADGAKIAGILLEAELLASGETAVVIGFGVNVAAAPDGLPYPATSLAALGVDTDATAVFATLADAWVAAYAGWDGGLGLAKVRERWLARAAGLGAPVVIRHHGRVLTGTFETIDEAGRLMLVTDDGARLTVAAGDVHFGATATLEKAG
jgi:BirA family biotin operon repressor/biotin-[acetyl-CoA-carboxylase] ligase